MIQSVKDNLDGVEAYITLAEACEITGYSRKHLERLCREGVAPCHQPGKFKEWRLKVSEIQAWMRGE